MKVLLIGGGGREHALAWALTKSKKMTKLFALPGSDAISEFAEILSGDPKDPAAVSKICSDINADLAVIGPEEPLAFGVADALRERGLPVFGPGRSAARLESSKAFAKDFMRRHGIPTANSVMVSDMTQARAALNKIGGRSVVKADGLAAGKGVTVCSNEAQALRALSEILEAGRFGAAGAFALVEERIEGKETSYMGLCDGAHFLALPASSDHKRLLDGDLGPNTGGMGVAAPTPGLTHEIRSRIDADIVAPTLAGLKLDGLDFRGLLYCGIMLTKNGPKLLEYNTRFGDPETQAVLPICDADWLELFAAAASQDLGGRALRADGAAVCVVLASEGYPNAPITGIPIEGLNLIKPEEALVFHAGTRKTGAGWETAGGRALSVVGVGRDAAQARARAYAAAEKIRFKGKQFRRDIAAFAALEKSR